MGQNTHADLLRFNGGIFADSTALPLNSKQIRLLIEAARANWKHVEPAIFGTLLERALDPEERHRLGAHYTPRAYVERLVMPTIIEPLRADWQDVQAAALTLDRQGKHIKAVEQIKTFHHQLCKTRVLDPACGSGNFLYVTLEHLKRLEGEVLNVLTEMGETQGLLELQGVTVDPHQMLGLETNPRAARIAESVLWIGYLQWHFRTRGDVHPPEPVLRDFHNIECRDAVLAWDKIEYVTDEMGRPVTRWDGLTYKTHPVTGELVPNENAQVPLENYINPHKAGWPEADFVVGNPPFIGTARMRQALGDGYVEALRKTYPRIPDSADFVMHWWHHAADLTRDRKIRRFGLITTNSLRQIFNRRVVQYHLEQKKPLSLRFAIPDHPWVDSADGAAVRIAMTVAEGGEGEGVLNTLIAEQVSQVEGIDAKLESRVGKLFSDLKIGVNVAGATALNSNSQLSSRGVMLFGSGFIVTPNQAEQLGLGRIPDLERYIREYRNGRDLTQTPRKVMVIDLFGLTAEKTRKCFPEVYQWIYERVKPEREHNRDKWISANWWLHGRPRSKFRPALRNIRCYIATVETSKHRFFVLMDETILPDNMLVNIALDSEYHLGVLLSRLHVAWALAAGGTLEDRPRYNKTRCFETFPFPVLDAESPRRAAPTEGLVGRIGALAKQLDAHHKRQQSLHPGLTLTGIYNVVEKLRRGEALTKKEKKIHELGLVSVLTQLHDELDAAVLEAYGWSDLVPALVGKPGGTIPYSEKSTEQAEAEEQLLLRLVDLNTERTSEEQRGIVRWLRPAFQNPGGEQTEQAGLEAVTTTSSKAATKGKPSWPKAIPEQVQAVRSALAAQSAPISAEQLARSFKRARTDRVGELLDTLVSLGQARHTEKGGYLAG